MPVEPALQNVLDQLNAADLPPLFSGDVTAARESYRTAALAGLDQVRLPEVAQVRDDAITGPHGEIPVRVYQTASAAPKPVIVFFHGGGWVVGDLDTHDKHVRRLASDVDATVVSVDYRRAPEHPFPIPYDECWAVTAHVAQHIATYGGGPLAVAGDSAGGNLAAAVAQTARDAGIELSAQLLIYPATDLVSHYPSRDENGVGYRLEATDMDDATAAYAGGTDLHEPRLSPIFAASLAELAPAVIGVAGYDPLRDDGLAYADKLAAAGVPVSAHSYPTLIHGFYGFYPISPDSDAAVTELNAELRAILRPAG